MSDGAEESMRNAGEVEEVAGEQKKSHSDAQLTQRVSAEWDFTLMSQQLEAADGDRSDSSCSYETLLLKEKTLEKHIKSQASVTPVPCHEHLLASSDHCAKAATALEQIGSGITEFNQHAFALFGSAGKEQNDTPGCLAGAIKAMDNEKDLLEKDKAAVVTYCNINPNDKLLQRRWILRKLNVSVSDGHNLLSDTLLPITPLDYYLPSFN
uniref:Uncharacterized protein n=1 Tax=Moniliophthora roreri TaxID=221103 RepID=A0A0W0ETK9_MONRR